MRIRTSYAYRGGVPAVEHALTVARNLTALDDLGRSLEERLEAIREDSSLPAEGRAAREQAVRDQARSRARALIEEMEEARADHQRFLAEERVTEPVTEADLALVEQAYRGGDAPIDLADRAVGLQDARVLRAIRRRLMYDRAKDGSYGLAEDAIAAVEDRLLPLTTGREREVLRAASDLRALEPSIPTIVQYAQKVIEGTARPPDRIGYAHALSAAGEEQPEEDPGEMFRRAEDAKYGRAARGGGS